MATSRDGATLRLHRFLTNVWLCQRSAADLAGEVVQRMHLAQVVLDGGACSKGRHFRKQPSNCI